MALISCPECKKQISDTASNCPSCGYKFTPEKIAEINKRQQQTKINPQVMRLIKIAGITFILGFIVLRLIIFYTVPERFRDEPKEVVVSSGWDGSVLQVKSWLKANIKDPDSLEFIEWSPVTKTNDGGFTVRVKYRAKNSFGGYVVDDKVFFLNSAGTITNNIDY